MAFSKTDWRNHSHHKHITTAEEKSLNQHLISSPLIHNAEHCFVYISTKEEVSLSALITFLLDHSKKVSIPHIDWKEKNMHMCTVDPALTLTKGNHDIYHPTTCFLAEKTPDIAIVPAVLLDKNGTRLGRGGGYYDRFFASHAIPIRIGVSSYPEVVEKLPREKHDIAMTHIATAQGIISI